MNILVFTSAMIENEFTSYQNNAVIKPNPSNQNFYAKLIKALSVNNKVVVVSHRPFIEGMFEDKELPRYESSSNGIKYFYTKVQYSKRYKLFEEEKEIIKVANEASKEFADNKFLVITDTLRVNLLKAAIRFSKRKNVVAVGMLTDNPANLSNTSNRFVRVIKNNVPKLDGYLSLSNGLLKAFHVQSKPNYIFEGLVDEIIQTKKPAVGNYYFFGGALYERYGIKNLINGFLNANVKGKLVIAGTGPLRQYIFDNLEKNSRVLYLSQLPKEEIYALEQNAIANINPRPFDRKLDEESVPSKLIEYLASGAPIISTIHGKLSEIFHNEIYWISDDSQEGITKAFEEFEKEDQKELKKMALNARTKVIELYGVRPQGERISYFLDSLNSSLSK